MNEALLPHKHTSAVVCASVVSALSSVFVYEERLAPTRESVNGFEGLLCSDYSTKLALGAVGI